MTEAMGYFSTIYEDNLPHRAKAVYMYLRDRANEKEIVLAEH